MTQGFGPGREEKKKTKENTKEKTERPSAVHKGIDLTEQSGRKVKLKGVLSKTMEMLVVVIKRRLSAQLDQGAKLGQLVYQRD